jgi:large subunit ribosomal protein L5
MNPTRRIRLGKLTLNMGAGESGPRLEKSKAILEKITGKKVVITKTHRRTTFGVAKKRPIGVMVTLRGEEARNLLRRMLEATENRLKPSQFDSSGNFSFGIHEYIHIPGIKYDPDVGILGMDVCVTLERPGFRVKRRKNPGSIGKTHRITPPEAIEWVRKEFGVEVREGKE